MSDQYLGEVRIFSFNFAPRGWVQCNGQLMAIQQFAALFSLLGTTYGGNGTNNFQLPNLQGRIPMHFGNGFVQGNVAGEERHLLIVNEIPAHSHTVNANSATATTGDPTGAFWADGGKGNFTKAAPNNTMSGAAIATSGGQPHENRQPYLVVNICIAVTGIFPSRN